MSMSRIVSVLINLVLLICVSEITCGGHRVKRIVGGKPSAPPPPDDPVVFARIYNRYARVEGFRNSETKIYSFLGLRYAHPPVGRNRFTRPQYRRLEGDINATKHGQPCPQPHFKNPNLIIGHEDCLLLNIFTPKMPDETTGLPVYVWIHPGSFRYGSAAQYGAESFAKEGIIFVPIQYRLGTLGIIGDKTKEFNGNLAMFDMTAAIRWVKEYISFFGGDPEQIKVMGHGSGAASAMYLSMSPLPRDGSFNGVVSMSGSAISQYAMDTDPVQSKEEIATINGCPTTNETEIVKCLRAKTAEEIVMNDAKVQTERLHGREMIKGIAGGVGFNPHIEEPDDDRSLPGFLVKSPDKALKEGGFPKIPLLIGVAKDETGNGITLKTVTDIWGSAQKFLDSLLGTVTKGLDLLLNIDKSTGNILKPVQPLLNNLGLTDLLKIPSSLRPDEVLQKLTECTTDALFNLPAVLSAQLWGKSAPAFLYSFEYKGLTSKGVNFLNGLPIVAGQKNPNFTAHGDDLGYIFEARNIFGKVIPRAKLTKPEDLKVRENFFSLLVKFAGIKPNASNDNSFFPKFGEGTNFIKISSKLEIGDNFRFCELSLWGAQLEAIKSTTCQGLVKTLESVTNVLSTATGTLLNGPLKVPFKGGSSGGNGLGGLGLGGGGGGGLGLGGGGGGGLLDWG